MKNRIYTILLYISCLLSAVALRAQQVPKKAIFILVDGIPADVLEKVPTPHLDSIAKAGKYLRAYVGGVKGTYSESPTISAVGYNSLLTGTWANKHNVWDNKIEAPNYQYPTIFNLFKKQYPDKTIAIFSSWLDNRTKLVGEGIPAAGNLRFDYHFDGYELDTVAFPHDPQRDFMHRIDNQVVEHAVNCLKQQAPDLSWVYLEYTDDMGHMYGDAEPFYSAVEKIDAQIGRLAQAIQYRQKKHNEDWLLVVTTDHGRDEETGKSHGGQTPRERSGWIILNKPQLNAYAQRFQPGIVDIMPTLTRFMDITVPVEVHREIDGVPLMGRVSLAGAEARYAGGKLDITWQALERVGKVKIWVADGNAFKTGGQDRYQLLAEVPLAQERALIDTKTTPSSFYKVVLEGPANTVNKWVQSEEKK